MVQGQKTRLRSIERHDLPTFQRWFNDWEVQRFLAVFYPQSSEDEERWFAGIQGQASEKVFGIETLDGVLIGNVALAGISPENRVATLGIVIGEKDYWSHGYGTDAIRALLKFAFDNMNLHRVQLTTIEFNTRAIRCYEKCGFRREGVLRQVRFREGRYWDEIQMGILCEEFQAQGAQHAAPPTTASR